MLGHEEYIMLDIYWLFKTLKLISAFVNLYQHLVGVRLGLFTPDLAFDVVAKKQIEMLKSPSLKLIDLVAEEMGKVVQGAVTKVLGCIMMSLVWPLMLLNCKIWGISSLYFLFKCSNLL